MLPEVRNFSRHVTRRLHKESNPVSASTKLTPAATATATKEQTLIARKKFIAPSQKLFFSEDPLKIVRAQGQYMFDETGVRYLDCINNVCHVGHCHKRVVEAGYRQMAQLNTNSRYLHDAMVTYAAHLASTLPGNLNTFFFTNSGSEANDLALNIADTVTGHTEHISVDGAYYGSLTSLLQLTTYKQKSIGPHTVLAPVPDVYRGEYRNTETAGILYANKVQKLIDSASVNNKTISCFISEAFPSSAGQLVLPKGYLQTVYKFVREAGGLCIADEIQVGFGRIGKSFWGFQLHGVIPDIVTVGKPMGNGHPIGGVVTTPEIAQRFAATGVSYFNTFGGNPVSMAIAEAVLNVIEEEGLQDNAHSLGQYLCTLLLKLQAQYPKHIGDIRGVGLFIGLEIVKDRDSREPHPHLAFRIINRMLIKHKVILSVEGTDKNVIKLKPPLCFNKENADSLVNYLDGVLKDETLHGPSQKLFFSEDPLKIVRAQGQYMFDEAGVRYLDCINNVCHVGHCHKRVVEAGYHQMAQLNTNSRYLHDAMVTYATHLASTLPGNLNTFFFTNSGSEANDLALQIADVVSGHTERVSINGAYHGHLSTLLSLSTYKMKSIGPHCIMAPLPDLYHGPYRHPDTAGVLYAGEVKKLIDEAATQDKTISCFIMESLLSCAGQVIPPKGYLQAVYKYTRDAGGLCIADEVQVGFGRVGKCFWGFELQGVIPDIVTIGKPMGNGHPVAGVVTTPEIAQRFAATGVSYFNTYGGNPVSMAIAEAVLGVIEDEGLQDHARSVGEYLLQQLVQLQSQFPTHIGDVRGVGLFIGLDIVKDRDSREPHPHLATKIVNSMLLKHKIILSVDGLSKNVIKFKPPMCFNRDNADLLVDCLKDAFINL